MSNLSFRCRYHLAQTYMSGITLNLRAKAMIVLITQNKFSSTPMKIFNLDNVLNNLVRPLGQHCMYYWDLGVLNLTLT